MSINNLSASDPEGTIPVPQAMQMTANWRTYLAATEQDFNVRSYLIPIISFQNLLLNNPDAEAVRLYIGLTNETDPTTSQLLLIPIVNGQEVPYLPGADKGINENDDDCDSNIYDLSGPCPPQCSTGTTLD